MDKYLTETQNQINLAQSMTNRYVRKNADETEQFSLYDLMNDSAQSKKAVMPLANTKNMVPQNAMWQGGEIWQPTPTQYVAKKTTDIDFAPNLTSTISRMRDKYPWLPQEETDIVPARKSPLFENSVKPADKEEKAWYTKEKKGEKWFPVDRNQNNTSYKRLMDIISSFFDDDEEEEETGRLMDTATSEYFDVPEKLFPERDEDEIRSLYDPEAAKRVEQKQRKEYSKQFWQDFDGNNVPTPEEILLAEGFLENSPWFLENNNLLKRYALSLAQERQREKENREQNGQETIEATSTNRPERRQLTEKEIRAIRSYNHYLSDEQRARIQNGDGFMEEVLKLPGEAQNALLDAMQAMLLEQNPQLIEDCAFMSSAVFYGIATKTRWQILESFKSKGYVDANDLVEVGLYDQSQIEERRVDDFVSLLNKEYSLRKRGETLDELQWDYNREQVADAASLIMDNLSGLGDWLVNGKSARAYGTTQDDFKPFKVEIPEENLTTNQPPKPQKGEQPPQLVAGKNFEKGFGEDLAQADGRSLRHPYVEDDSGDYAIPDYLLITPDGKRMFFETKLNATTELSKNQSKLFPIIQKFGIKLKGKRTIEFAGAKRIPQTEVYKVFKRDSNTDEFFKQNNITPVDLNELIPGFTGGDKYGAFRYR